jgi:hypothetical protein
MKTTALRSLSLLALIGLLSACAMPGVDTGPTPYPVEYFPTVVALTGQAAMATNLAGTPSETPLQPSLTPTTTETPIPPTLAPTHTPTPPPSARGAKIQIQAPGPMSKVISPLHIRMQVESGGSELVQVDLQGEDGRLLARKLERVPYQLGGYYVSLKIPFEIRAAAELGRVTVSTKDAQGRLRSLEAEHIILLSVGEAEIAPVGEQAERVVFYTPKRKETVSGGVLRVEGRYLPFNDQPVVLELLDPEGNTVGLRVLDLEGSEEQLFSTTIPYKSSEPFEAILVFRQDDVRIAGLMYWHSQVVTLFP